MTKGNSHKIYTAAELRRYHAGQMSAEEMHALEKAALEDPMLSDALDGYAKEEKEEDSIAQIQERLSSIKQTVKVVPFNKKVWSSVAVAASIIFIAGYGYFAMNERDPQQHNTQQASVDNKKNKKDTVHKSEEKEKPVLKIEDTISHPTLPDNHQNGTTEGFTGNARFDFTADNQGSFSPSNPVIQANDRAKTEENDNKDASIVDAKKVSKPQQQEKASEAPVAMEKFKADSNLTTYWAIASAQNQQLNKGNDDLDGIFDKNTLAANSIQTEQVVVTSSTSYVSNTKQKSRKESATAQVQTTTVDHGNSNFEKYLQQNRPTCDIDKGSKKGRVVELRFQVDEKGKPIKIKVTKSVNKICDQEVIRFLEAGPAWDVLGPKNRTVVIPIRVALRP